MEPTVTIAIASDVHYASAAEQARGSDYELRTIPNPVLRRFITFYRHFFWARDPLHRNHLLDRFMSGATADHAIVCGDLTCDTGFTGLSDPAAKESAGECLSKLRQRFQRGVDVALGDHDLGKMTFFGQVGGMRLESLEVLQQELRCPAFWVRRVGHYTLMGVTSSLIAYPAFESEAREQDRPVWAELSRQHMEQIESAFAKLSDHSKVFLFCHDPTALPFLLNLGSVRNRLPQVEHTFIGHLHSRLILAKGRILAGMPQIRFLGHTASKLSAALRQARLWRPFNIVLCPALAGIELLKDGGFCEVDIDPEARKPAVVRLVRLSQAL